jgi:DNA-binding transcriptional LysR family regulator
MGAETLATIEPDSFGLGTLNRPGAGPDGRAAGVEIRQLRYFVRVAEERHFGRAAARLYITQPGLSQAIARLERELDVQLFTRTRNHVELTPAGTELLHRARRLLADLEEAVTRVRVVGRGDAGLVRVGVALLTEPIVAPALKAFHHEHEGIVLDRSAMVSERLLEELREGRLDAAVIHQVPVLSAAEAVAWEPLRRGRLAVLASPFGQLARRGSVRLSELRDETFLVDSRSLAPGSFEGFKLMCREHGGFDAHLLESAAAPASSLDADWRLIQDGTAIAVVAEDAARAVPVAGVAVVSVDPPPQYVLALAWPRDEHHAAAERFVRYLLSYRDQHAWLTRPEPAAAAL